MLKNRMLAVTFVLCLAAGAAGENRLIDGPVLGYLFDSTTRAVLTIHGIPAAASLAQGPAFPAALETAAAAPASGVILGVAREDGALWMLRKGAAARVAGVAAPVERVLLSPGGTSAAVFGAGKAQVLRNLQDKVAAGDPVELDATAAAVSDSGALLWVSAEGRLMARDAGMAGAIPAPGEPVALAFVESSTDAVVAFAGSLWLLRDAAGRAEWLSLAEERDGAGHPRLVAASGGRIFALNRGGEILIVPREGGPPTRLACPCDPTTLERLDRDLVFRLTESAPGEPVWLLDAREPEPRFRFIPAFAGAAGTEEAQ